MDTPHDHWKAWTVTVAIALAFAVPGALGHGTPGVAGMTKMPIYDETDDGWNVRVGEPDPEIGFVNFRTPTAGDPATLLIVVALKDGAPLCDLDIEVVTMGEDPGGGLPADGLHDGVINLIGSITTNAQGKGNSGTIAVDVTTLSFVAPSGNTTYAHVDIEDNDRDCLETDGTPVVNNEYGASSSVELEPGTFGTIFHWTQP